MKNPTMMDALRLTREGRLGEATVMIQGMLVGGATMPTVEPAPAPRPRIRSKRLPSATPAQPPAANRSAPAGYTAHVHETGQGRIRYTLYRPAMLVEPAPLVVMLHGCTQSADDFARGTQMNALADERGFMVAYPEQSRSANAQGCWNWFRPVDQARDRGEPALIADLTRELIVREGVDPARVYIAGLSAGGAAAAIMGQAYPDLYAAIGVHSGLACGAAHDLSSALGAMQRGPGQQGPGKPTTRAGFVPTFIVHGDADHTVNVANAEDVWAQTLAASPVALATREERVAGPGARSYIRQTATDANGHVRVERWIVQGGGHAWAGGASTGSYTDPGGPDASCAMLRFFLDQALA